MIIDSSALVAIVLAEPDFAVFVDRIAKASTKRMSSVSLLETSIVVNRRKGGEGVAILEQFIDEARIDVISLTPAQGRLAFDAYRRFGKGTGHPAQLNILDCCTYALAAESLDSVLFKGTDFDRTDIAVEK